MNPEQHALVGHLFARALEIEEHKRESFLASSDEAPEIIAEVRALLQEDSAAVPLLDAVIDGAQSAPEIPGFELEEQLGRGGMGVVYAARQLDPPRAVAIKLVTHDPGGAGRERFRREVELSARLAHPAVARVYEVGQADGVPFVVMERVDGLPLDQWLQTVAPPIERKLELFQAIGSGVAHAHGRGVLHRDLKPANVLVDERGGPRVLDFGIARPLAEADRAGDEQTRTGMVLGTLPYMSPEQAAGRSEEIDVRTDIYALGVVLFEMIEGRRPIDVGGLSIVDASRRIAEARIPALAHAPARIRADLQVILMRALAKEPEQRYSTVDALAEDVGRVLRDEPILARPPSTAYLLSRFVRRHRPLVAAASLVAVALVTATVISLTARWEADAANADLTESNQRLERTNAALETAREAALEEARRADQEATTANAFVNFVIETLLEEDPSRMQEPSLRGAIERVAAGAPERLADQPVVLARLERFLGRMMEALGRPIEAWDHLSRAEALFATHAPEHASRADLRLERSHQALRTDRLDEATAMLETILATPTLDPARRVVALSLQSELMIRLKRLEEAESAARMAWEIARSGQGDAIDQIEWTIYVLAGVHAQQGKAEEALPLLKDLLAVRSDRLSPEHPLVAETRHALGVTLRELERWQEALDVFAQALDAQTAQLGPEHTATLRTRRDIALITEKLGKEKEALEEVRALLELQVRLMGETSLEAVTLALDEVGILLRMGRYEEAEKEGVRIRALLEPAGPSHYLKLTEEHLLAIAQLAGTPRAGIYENIAINVLALGGRNAEAMSAVEDVANTALVEKDWPRTHRWFDEVLKLVDEGHGTFEPAQLAIMAIISADAASRVLRPDALRPVLEAAHARARSLELEAQWRRRLIEADLRLAEMEGDPDRKASLRKALEAIEERKG